MTQLTQEEAQKLLEMLKKTLEDQVSLPLSGKSVEFLVEGESKKDIFAINIYRGGINKEKYNIGARVKINNVVLMELHINPTTVHANPDGEKIRGSHWHIYKENYGHSWAFPAEDLESNSFVSNTLLFMKEFNVIELPQINYQEELSEMNEV